MTIREALSRFLKPKTPALRARENLLSVSLGKGDIAIDCGANVGLITQHLCSSGATVYAFEPNPHAFTVLQDTFSDVQNVHCIPKGVSHRTGTMKLYLHEHSAEDEVHWSTGSSLLDFKGNVLIDKHVTVQVIDLCEFVASLHHRVRVLKMDVEGAECPILDKLINTGVIDKIDYAFVETHDDKIPELAAETNAIRRLITTRGIRNIDLAWP
jgi:FkbM family methyltransferase